VPCQDAESYVHYVARYAKLCESVVRVVPDDDIAYSNGLGDIERERADAIHRRIDPGWPAAAEFPPPVIAVGRPDETLHKALDAYIAGSEKEAGGDHSGWLGTQIRQATTLKDHHEDRPLGLVSEEAIRAMAKYWEARPRVKGRDKAVSVVTARKQWECLVRFLRHVHKSHQYLWRLPEGVPDDIRFKAKTTVAEDAATASALQVRVWSPAQLAVLYHHSTPLVRSMMLLGLNCGFYAIDIGLAQAVSVRLAERHPHTDYFNTGEQGEGLGWWHQPCDWLMALRNKTKVYGEFVLWPHTAAAIRWAEARKRSYGLTTPLLLPTRVGTKFTEATEGGNKPSRIPNLWQETLRKACGADATLPELPFSSLRDTGADLIRKKDDTAANLYLRHGKPYKNDSLMERYANRPFLRLHQQLRRLDEVLTPLWKAVSDPFENAATEE